MKNIFIIKSKCVIILFVINKFDHVGTDSPWYVFWYGSYFFSLFEFYGTPMSYKKKETRKLVYDFCILFF